MSRLKVLLRGAQLSDLNLNPEQEYIGGRKENCDIRLQPEKGISREHFKLKFEEGRWVLHSLSRFGEIYSSGQRVETSALEHGQIFQVPPYEFEFSDVPESEQTAEDANKALEVGENENTFIGVTQQVPYIKMMSSDGQVREMLRLEVGDVWVAGRDPSCQIIIPDQRVSRRQFEVRKINGIYTIIDLTSVNGTFLNGSPISNTDPQALKSGDAITVLDNTMYFELHDPNFQYRMERIEVPQIPLNAIGSEEVNNHNVPFDNAAVYDPNYDPALDPNQVGNYPVEVDQGYSDQLNPDGSPFTGMPEEQMQGDYYTMQDQAEAASPAQVSPVVQAWNNLKNNKPVFYSLIALLLVGMYFLSEALNAPPPKVTQNVNKSTDPFSKLSPQEQSNVELWYNTASQALLQSKYQIAKENLTQIHKLLPLGYKDSLSKENEALSGEQTLVIQQENERREKEQEENLAKIQVNLEECRKSITSETTVLAIRNCLSQTLTLDPTNPVADKMIVEVERAVKDRQEKEDYARSLEQQQRDMKALFEKAEEVNKVGYPQKTIKAYNDVINSSLHDPEGYKEISAQRIKLIEKKVDKRNHKNIENAEVYLKEGKLKEGIMALRSALIYDPDNKVIKEKIERYSNELRNKVKVLYQESIIEENYGYVDTTENREGAKDKWKKIVETDLEDGDYYRKAYIKLKRYGVF